MKTPNNWLAALVGLWLLLVQTVFSQSLDSFNPNLQSPSYPFAYTIAIQPDGKVLTGGNFTICGGLNRYFIARVNSDGSLDPTFNPMGNISVNSIAIQTDGKIIVGGDFNVMGGQSISRIARLNSDGSLDKSFNTYPNSGSIFSIKIQPDGKLLVGGIFTNLSGFACSNIGRLNNDGTFDTNFSASANQTVESIAIQTNGSILVAGAFTNLDGAAVNYIGRLNSDGSLDTSFNPMANNYVRVLNIQSDNKIIVGGTFTNISNSAQTRLARLNTDGSVDTNFNASVNNTVLSIALQANGKILIGGSFTGISNNTCYRFARLNTNGTAENVFYPGVTNNAVWSLALQNDGGILVGGEFTNLMGTARNSIGRLSNNDLATEAITNNGSTITWMRGGSSPEVLRTTMEISTNGSSWYLLGAGTRISGGWQMSGLHISTNCAIRLTGVANSAAYFGGATYNIQSYAGAPIITGQPASQKSIIGTNVTFGVVAGGSMPLSYQWWINGNFLTNGGKFSGVTNAAMTISNPAYTNAGNFSVVVSNTYGSVTSSVVSFGVVNTVTNDSFNPNPGQTSGGQGNSTVCQIDGKVVVADSSGFFQRYTTNAAVDASFAAPSISSSAGAGSIQIGTDNLIWLGGSFTSFSGQTHQHLGQLNLSGTTNNAFSGTANGTVLSSVRQPDGKLVIVGTFTQVDGQAVSGIARLNTDGSLDSSFNGVGTNNTIYCVALQTNGQILIGGEFSTLGGVAQNRIARLNANGSLDTTFNPPAIYNYFAQNPIYCLLVLPDSQILVGGSYYYIQNGVLKPWLMRLNADGTLDTTFNGVPNGAVYSLGLQADGKIIVGGSFSYINGISQTNLTRLNSDGTLDTTFIAGANGTVNSVAIQPDGKILAGGGFTYLNDSKKNNTRVYFGRYINTETAAHGLSFDGSTITWTRSATSPEFAWVKFESSNDGLNWTPLGAGTPANGGWQLAGVATTVTNCIRAWGYVPCGQYNGSGWLAMDYLNFATNLPPTVATGGSGFGFANGNPTNAFGFNIGAMLGQNVVVETSTNLVNWSPAVTNGFIYSPFYYSDTNTPAVSNKFYRVRLN